MKKIGLTGNIASGKSTVENIIKDLGYKVIDADLVCHDAMENNSEIMFEIKELFSDYDIVDENGELSRGKIAKIVFYSDKYREKLESILHPYVTNKIEEFFEEHNSDNIVFASVPLLFEAGMEKLFDKIIFVSSKENIRLERLIRRNGFSKDEAKNRISVQKPEDDKICKSDFAIYNDGNVDELFEKVKMTLEKL